MNTNITNVDDLRTAFLTVFDDFAVQPQDLVVKGKVNVKYARQMLAELKDHGLVTDTDVNDEGNVVWQTVSINIDDTSHDEAVAYFDQWLSEQEVEVTDAPAKPVKEPKSKTLTDCLCGCGEKSANHYRPGHDARHAGQIGREIAANYKVEGFDRRVLLADLPSDKLVAKAEAVAETAIKKIEAKQIKAQIKAAKESVKEAEVAKPEVEQGVVKVGKHEFAATRTSDGKVTYYDKDKERVASKTAAATFAV